MATTENGMTTYTIDELRREALSLAHNWRKLANVRTAKIKSIGVTVGSCNPHLVVEMQPTGMNCSHIMCEAL